MITELPGFMPSSESIIAVEKHLQSLPKRNGGYTLKLSPKTIRQNINSSKDELVNKYSFSTNLIDLTIPPYVLSRLYQELFSLYHIGGQAAPRLFIPS